MIVDGDAITPGASIGQKYVLNKFARSADSIGQLIPLEGSDSIYLHFRLFRKRAIERHIPGSNAA